MRMRTKTLVLMVLSLVPLAGISLDLPANAPACGQPGQWLVHAGGKAAPAEASALLQRLAGRQAVLLGETHSSAEDHRWQLHTLAQLHARRPQLAIGFEMFPRRLQPVLDRWVEGELSEAEFLRQAEWGQVWDFDPGLYLPLFHYARMNRLPMLALNVERSLVDAVDKDGWEAVPEARREGVTRPAPPLPDYLAALRQVFTHHVEKKQDAATFARFVEAQTVWDRAMAQAIAAYLKGHPDALVVGILGVGHVRHGYGVAHQLKALGIAQVANLATWEAGDPCTDISPGLADAVYVVQPPAAHPPRLGITMAPDKDGVRITQVVAGSIAERAGCKAGDVVLEIAGRPARAFGDVRGAVERQAAGTWLPMKVRRDGTVLELVARFPAEP